MKNLRARTKFYKKFVRIPITITSETAVIMINGRIVDLGRKGLMNGRQIRIAFCSDDQQKACEKFQERYKKPREYWGRMKDDVFFIYGYHRYTQKGSFLTLYRKYKQNDAQLDDEMIKDNCFTGKHRSGDQRKMTAAIKIPAKIKEEKTK